MSKLFSALFVTLSISAISFSVGAGEGGMSGGGGGALGSTPVNELELQSLLQNVSTPTRLALNSLEVHLSPHPNQASDDRELFEALFGKPENEDAYRYLEKVAWEINPTGPCIDKEGNEYAAYAFVEENKICYSVPLLASTIKREGALAETVALTVHEITHLMGYKHLPEPKDERSIPQRVQRLVRDKIGINSLFELHDWILESIAKVERLESSIGYLNSRVAFMKQEGVKFADCVLLGRLSVAYEEPGRRAYNGGFGLVSPKRFNVLEGITVRAQYPQTYCWSDHALFQPLSQQLFNGKKTIALSELYKGDPFIRGMKPLVGEISLIRYQDWKTLEVELRRLLTDVQTAKALLKKNKIY